MTDLLQAAGWTAYLTGSDVEPALIALSDAKGVVVLDTVRHADDSATFNERVANLREAVPVLKQTLIQRRLIDPAASESTERIFALRDALDAGWLERLPDRALSKDVFEAVEQAYAARVAIDLPLRERLEDDGADARDAQRIKLDAVQSAMVQRDVEDVVVLSGPPGSGKSLILAARAKWLASQHPGWRIRLVCFNRVLVPYLEQLVWGHANITVQTFGRFAHSLGYAISLNDEERAGREAARHVPEARKRPVVDALLIDEWQDFLPAWTALALATVRPGRGGAVLAGDARQALYRDSSFEAGLEGHEVERLELKRSYRSTSQILQVTAALDPSHPALPLEGALEGEPVDLVWTEKVGEQGAAVARDIRLLLESGDRVPQDIGVLVTRKFAMGRIAGLLRDEDVPCRAVYSNQADELDLAEPTVKITTVHSAKGLEFAVVFLVGLEHLPDPDGTEDADRQGRTGYVGTTRAKDQLVMLYSKDNVYLERVRTLPETLLRRWVWPDDYSGA